MASSFVKWTALYSITFIGVYLYVSGKKHIPGNDFFRDFGGAEENVTYLKDLLKKFDLQPFDFMFCYTDYCADAKPTELLKMFGVSSFRYFITDIRSLRFNSEVVFILDLFS